ncbi:VWA domain-containing protein [Candidatus Chloroploca asiatica]|uniref:VWA domain-containing protein n=1 Tax=Candidatus Chloroploca asiatica TaxID=1506545 RepID=UPI0015585BA2|nr:VWA domain-containing protein [Candidatus Chloroploca asiatica]
MPSQEDIEIQQERLQLYRRTLAHYLRQQAELGSAYIPPGITNGILDARRNIHQIKNTLRSWNIILDDHPDDDNKADEIMNTSISDISTTSPVWFRQIRQQALKAYFVQQWNLAEELFIQVLAANSEDDEVRSKLKVVQQYLELDAFYQTICDLRNEGQWRSVLNALADLEEKHPKYPDPQNLRQWAMQQLELDVFYQRICDLRHEGRRPIVLNALADLEERHPKYPDPQNLRQWATQRWLPVYLLIDVSSSMSGAPIQAMNQGMALIWNELMSDGMAVELAAISVISFSSSAQQLVPLTPIIDFCPPELIVNSKEETNLGCALQLLENALQQEFVSRSYTCMGDYLPIAFIMLDGNPTDEWTTQIDRLLKYNRFTSIVIICCGLLVSIAYLASQVPDPRIAFIRMEEATPDSITHHLRYIDQISTIFNISI